MATIRLRLRSQPPESELFEVRGAVEGNPTGISNLVAIVVKDEPLPIEGLSDGPLPTFTASILGVPSPPEFVTPGTLTTLTAEVRDQNNDLVDAVYTPANWSWAIETDQGGGASFGGADNDDLTVGAAGTLVFSATHTETGAVAMATIQVVSAIVLMYVLEGLPADVVEDTSYPMTARVLNFDGSQNEAYIAANWTFTVEDGPATITGVDSDVLTVDAVVTPPDTITVRATHSSDPGNFDEKTVNAIDPPGGAFPEVLPPAGHTVILANQGDTKAFGGGWVPQLDWADNAKLEIVADGSSKFGNALQRNSFIGDSGWLDAWSQGNNVANHRELYMRYVFRLTSNWQRNAEEHVIRYGRKLPGASVDQFIMKLTPSSPGIRWQNVLTGDEVGDATQVGIYNANTPPFTVLSLDTYHTIEILHRLNTLGNADGSLRVAIDGVEVTSWLHGGSSIDVRSGVEWVGSAWDPPRFTGLQVFHRWGSSGTKSVNDWVRMSELYISGGND